jgi:XTP/dITP diphosphohydrolase
MRYRQTVILGTRSPGKLREIKELLNDLPLHLISLGQVGEIPEAAEDGETFAANARKKALHYARATGQWCLGDDSGLVVDALNGAPGVRSARYAGNRCAPNSDRETITEANNARLLEELKNVPDEKRTARFICHLVLADPQSVLIETSGTVEGRIAHHPRGTSGFGYDPLFVIPELRRTAAELTPEEKNRISHRGKAVRRLKTLLEDLLRKQDGQIKT